DDLAFDRLLPVFLAGPQVEAGEVVPPVAPGVGVGHVDASGPHGGHAHQGGAQPLLPDRCALDGQDLQLAAPRVEDAVSFADSRRGGPAVRGLVLPGEAAVAGVEGVEIVATEAPADEDAAINYRWSCQAPAARNGDFPAPKPPVRAQELGRLVHPR